MAYVVLPSKTAKLVYGYLIQENMDELASQFLQASPYLKDCCEIVKRGYHFNTKFKCKDLNELLQEYSTIQHIVDKKVNLLLKTSLLYKRIKLRCETLPEIIELILFWRYKKSNENAVGDENSAATCHNTNSSHSNCVQDYEHNNLNDNNINNQCSLEGHSTNGDCHNRLTKIDENRTEEDLLVSDTNNISVHSNNGNQFHSVHVNKSDDIPVNTQSVIENAYVVISNEKVQTTDNDINSEKCDQHLTVHNDNQYESDHVQDEDDSHGDNEVFMESEVQGGVSNEEMQIDSNNIQIVHIETESHDGTQQVQLYPKPAEENDAGMRNKYRADNNNSIVYVNSSVADMTISSDPNQIIVIPLDYYKQGGLLFHSDCRSNIDSNEQNVEMQVNSSSPSLQNNNGNFEDSSASKICQPSSLDEDNADAVQNILNSATNERVRIVCEKSADKNNSTTATATTTEAFESSVIRNPVVDNCIVTESSFLNNQDFIYDLTNRPPVTYQNLTVLPPQSPVILVPPPRGASSRFRNILPKKQKPKFDINPIVVVHPLLKNNQDLTQIKPAEVKSRVELPRKTKKRRTTTRRTAADSEIPEVLDVSHNMPSINFCTTPMSKEGPENQDPVPLLDASLSENEKTQEEEENQEKPDTVNETPVIPNPRNTRRLSLSTPRRRSHIRALEFETPPKTRDEKKKSQTSPKVRVDHVNVDRKNVRNTLFKSPDTETIFKSPTCLRSTKKNSPKAMEATQAEAIECLNEMSIPIATRSPQAKLSDAWGNLTGVDCVLGQTEVEREPKKCWDADLRGFIIDSDAVETAEKKRMRKPGKVQQSNKTSVKKKCPLSKKSKSAPVTVTPSKISLTAKRNTYSISENEQTSPVRSIPEDLRLETPFKDLETTRPADETPFTKLLRENVSGIDIDLSMINTPTFPPTPSILITPDMKDEVSALPVSNYYTPMKDDSKSKSMKITDYFQVDSTKKKETKENHEKEIDELVTEAKKIIGLCGDNQEDHIIKKPPTGKILSMVKIQMITQCDKKLCENIPINESSNFLEASIASATEITTVIDTLTQEVAKTDLKGELEEKKQRALKKIKVVREKLAPLPKNKVTKKPARKRKRTNSDSSKNDKKSKADVSGESNSEKQASLSIESSKEEGKGEEDKPVIVHSTPYTNRKRAKFEASELEVSSSKSDLERTESSADKLKVDNNLLDEIRNEFPSFQNNSDHPELIEKSRKKLHYVKHFLKLDEVVRYLDDYNEKNPPKLMLKPCFRKFFQVFYKWLKHPHRHELNASEKTKVTLNEYLILFEKIGKGLNRKIKSNKKLCAGQVVSRKTNLDILFKNYMDNKSKQSDDDESIDSKIGVKWNTAVIRKKGDASRTLSTKDNDRRREDESEDGVEGDGVVSTLPLKKRKATVQTVETKATRAENMNHLEDLSLCPADSASQTQNFLQDIDVDRFLSQIHGRESS